MSLMAAEIREIPHAVARLLADPAPVRAAAMAARALNPALIATVARGSSDHACTYLAYAAQLTLGLPVASIGPSVASIYARQLRLQNALCISVSQSGQSPDIVAMAHMARLGGAMTVAVTNHPASPLGHDAERSLFMKSRFAFLLLTLTTISATSSGGSQPPGADSSLFARYAEPADVAAFSVSVGGAITPVIVELKGDPTVVQKVAGEQAGKTFSIDQLAERSLGLGHGFLR